ncbi:hypothetical protein BTN49_2315 (plasmid) [Candidatus Enterovibrio escicola]|uniref:Uncharacterized protein n=1 Tax=Candidatus Enterovibrio escicola TaxID=1927127 RepID=A0A2A5T1W3_9GAMM|nr:hypothetical protein BTN49_2315 [Candidatus Enterovibrio escacola]
MLLRVLSIYHLAVKPRKKPAKKSIYRHFSRYSIVDIVPIPLFSESLY